MDTKPLDLLARLLALATSRRGSLLTLGGTGMAAITSLSLAEAGKKSRKKGKKDKKCQRQVGQCNGYFVSLCQEERAPEECVELIGACCEFLGACQAEAFIDCLMTIIRPPRPVSP